MITPRTCVDLADIRVTIRTHYAELVREMQELLIASAKHTHPLSCVLVKPQKVEASVLYTTRESVTLAFHNQQIQVTIALDDIVRFEVLATRLMTPDYAYRQMKEMERIVGL